MWMRSEWHLGTTNCYMDETKGRRGCESYTNYNPSTAWPRPLSMQSSIWYGWDLAKMWMKLRWMRSRNYYSYMEEIKGNVGNTLTAIQRLPDRGCFQGGVQSVHNQTSICGLGNSCFMFSYVSNQQSINSLRLFNTQIWENVKSFQCFRYQGLKPSKEMKAIWSGGPLDF